MSEQSGGGPITREQVERAVPIDDSCPERLRERREALGWTTAYAGHWVPWFDHTDVERAESGKGIPAFVARYAAALSAAEAERAEEGADRVITAIGRPPAPEVVDVPQPLVKRFGGVEASWGPGRLDVITLEEINGDDEPFDVPIALLRAMLAAIDAQQQPDPQPDLDEGWRIVSGDTAFAMPFGTIRECSGCGCLVSGGPTACLRCIDAQQGGA